MKGIKAFNAKSAIATGVSVLGAGAGSAIVDWVLAKYNVLPSDWSKTVVNVGKVAVGAIAGSMIKNQIIKSAADGIATVAAANLVSDLLPESETETPSGLPEGTIGRLRMGQRGFRRARIAGLGVQNGVIAK